MTCMICITRLHHCPSTVATLRGVGTQLVPRRRSRNRGELCGMNLYWHPEPPPEEWATVQAWIEANDCSDVAVLSIGPTTIIAYGTNDANRGWGTIEIRRYHDDLRSALAAVLLRLPAREPRSRDRTEQHTESRSGGI